MKLAGESKIISLETDKTRPISQPNFSQKIEDVFYKVYKEPICDRYLRMSWISGLMKTNPTKKEMKELARLMAHSTDEQSKYNKIKNQLHFYFFNKDNSYITLKNLCI